MKMRMLPCLDFDIQVEILKRLPVKSLIRFRSVCKVWKSLIDSSRFIAGHNDGSSEEHLMIRYRPPCWVGSKEVKYVSFVDDDSFPQNKFAPPVPPILVSLYGSHIIDSSCGLVCLEGSLPPDGSSKTQMVVLWNPYIRKSIAIVMPNEVQSRSHRFVGFGVCPETKDPKLVNISSKNDDQNPYCQVMVFTLSSREWRCLSSSNQLPRKSLEFDNTGQTVIGRFLYQFVFEGEFYLILSFDLSTDEFREVPVPDSLHQSFLTMSKLRESLVLIDHLGRDSTADRDVFDVWMMMEDGAFTKLFTIKNASVESILGFKKTGEPLVEIRSPNDVNGVLLAVYEPCLDHIKDLEICRAGLCFCMCSYNESLLLLDHDDGCIVSCGAVKS